MNPLPRRLLLPPGAIALALHLVACGGSGGGAPAATDPTLTVQKAGAGTGRVAGATIDCGTTCSATVPAGSVVTLGAIDSLGSSFSGWTGCDSTTSSTCTVTVNSSRSVGATFASDASASRTLTVVREGVGSGSVSGGGISCGSTCTAATADGAAVTLTATPGSGFAFAGWGGCDTSSGNSCTVRMASNRTVSASFAGAFSVLRTLSVAVSGTGSGVVTGVGIGAGFGCGGTCSNDFTDGSWVTLNADPATGSSFAGWVGCDFASGSTCEVRMTSARAVTASFQGVLVPVRTVQALKSGAGAGTISGNGIACGLTCSSSVAVGTTVTLTATPATGSTFVGWTGCDRRDGNTCTFRALLDRKVTATFGLGLTLQRLITIERNGHGQVAGDGGIDCGSTCTTTFPDGASFRVTATPASGSTFRLWSGCGTLSTLPTCDLHVTTDHVLEAIFDPAFTGEFQVVNVTYPTFYLIDHVHHRRLPSVDWSPNLATTPLGNFEKVKARHLEPGTYAVFVSGTDGGGRRKDWERQIEVVAGDSVTIALQY